MRAERFNLHTQLIHPLPFNLRCAGMSTATHHISIELGSQAPGPSSTDPVNSPLDTEPAADNSKEQHKAPIVPDWNSPSLGFALDSNFEPAEDGSVIEV